MQKFTCKIDSFPCLFTVRRLEICIIADIPQLFQFMNGTSILPRKHIICNIRFVELSNRVFMLFERMMIGCVDSKHRLENGVIRPIHCTGVILVVKISGSRHQAFVRSTHPFLYDVFQCSLSRKTIRRLCHKASHHPFERSAKIRGYSANEEIPIPSA